MKGQSRTQAPLDGAPGTQSDPRGLTSTYHMMDQRPPKAPKIFTASESSKHRLNDQWYRQMPLKRSLRQKKACDVCYRRKVIIPKSKLRALSLLAMRGLTPSHFRSNALFQTQMALVSGAISAVLNAHFRERTHGRNGVTGLNPS